MSLQHISMGIFRIVFGLALVLFLGCSTGGLKEGESTTDFNATFNLTAAFQYFGPIDQKDFQTEWVFTKPTPGMHVKIDGVGDATPLGKTELEIEQWWTKLHPDPPVVVTGFFSYGQGHITFTAENGDKLYATYWGWADHQDDPPTEILTNGEFTGGTGKYEEATGAFTWEGLFVASSTPLPSDPPATGTVFGTGNVTVTGTLEY